MRPRRASHTQWPRGSPSPGTETGELRRLEPDLPVEQPKDERQYHADDQAGDDRKVEAEGASLDHDIPGQPPEPEFPEPFPRQPDGYEYETNRDEPAAHELLSTSWNDH